MIIRGSARAGPVKLAGHLLKKDENERVSVIEMRGVSARTMTEALREMHAMGTGCKATRTLYHAAINVRAERDEMTPERWARAVDALEAELGFTGQPRIVVRHVKKGREHTHVVWSRIDADRNKAISDSHNYRYHERVARTLELEFGHELTPGVHIGRDGRPRPERTPSLDDIQQEKRTRIPLDQIRQDMRDAWSRADNGSAFKAAIEERGYVLARGDSRDYVAVDWAGAPHSIPRMLDKVKTAAFRARFADLADIALPSVEEARELQAQLALAQEERAQTEKAPERVAPDKLLDHLLTTRSYVTVSDLARAAERLAGADTPEAVQAVIAQALRRGDLLTLRDRDGEMAGFTTAAVRQEEEHARTTARSLANRRRADFDPAMVREVAARRGLSSEQQAALEHALGPEGLAAITGRAGTGKTHTLAVLNEISSTAGWRVIGLSPTNTLAQDLQECGFTETRTAHSLLWHLENVPTHQVARLNSRTLLAIDEAAMLDTRTLGLLLQAAERSGARVALIGDDRQLASVQRGGLFADLTADLGSAELSDVRRQKELWARNASRAFAAGRFREGLDALDRKGQIHFSHDLDTAAAELVEAWRRDTAGERGNRFAFAYTNADVRTLNRAIQEVEIEHGRVTGLQEVPTDRGRMKLGTGDRILLHGTDKAAKLYNGAAGTVERIEVRQDGHAIITARTDKGRVFAIDTQQFAAFGLGYSGTIYKGQGKTLDQAYLLHTHHWRDASSYVALTRSRGATELFVAEAQAPDVAALARQMERQQHRGSTLRYSAEAATAQEIREIGMSGTAPSDRAEEFARGAAEERAKQFAEAGVAEQARLDANGAEYLRREEKRRDDAMARQQAEALQQALDQMARQQARDEWLQEQQKIAVEQADREAAAPPQDNAPALSEGLIHDAGARYAQALGRHYNIVRPYESLARAAAAEHAAFVHDRQQLDIAIARETDPVKLRRLELQQKIELAEYMSLTDDRLAMQSRIITGRQDSEQSVWHTGRAEKYRAEAKALRLEYRELDPARQTYQPDYAAAKGRKERIDRPPASRAPSEAPEVSWAARAPQEPESMIARVQAAERQQLADRQREATRREEIERRQTFEREQAEARQELERRYRKEDVEIAAARLKEDKMRGKRGLVDRAMEALSHKRVKERQMAELRIVKERQQQDRQRADQRRQEIAQTGKVLTEEQRRRERVAREARQNQFKAERAQLHSRQRGVALQDLKKQDLRQQEIGRGGGKGRGGDGGRGL